VIRYRLRGPFASTKRKPIEFAKAALKRSFVMAMNWMNFALVLSVAALNASVADNCGAATTKPQWQADYGQALAETRSEERPLVVVLDDPACQDQSVDGALLTGKESAKLLAKYELCHVDVSTEYGQAVAKVFNVKSYPHVAIIDREGKSILHRHAGPIDASAWKSTLEQHQAGVKPATYTVAKPIVMESEVSTAEPMTYTPPADEFSMPTVNYAPKPYCAKCQRGY
jgi:hypothetical protein